MFGPTDGKIPAVALTAYARAEDRKRAVVRLPDAHASRLNLLSLLLLSLALQNLMRRWEARVVKQLPLSAFNE